MHRRGILAIAASVAFGFAFVPGLAHAQQKTIKEQLLGAWTVLIVDGVAEDNTQSPLFGPNPVGSLIFSPEGRFSWQVMRTVNRPPFASGSRDNTTADENKAEVQGTLSFFGSYTVDEAAKAINLRIEGDSFPNAQDMRGKWQVTAITDEVLTYELPIAASSTPKAPYVKIQGVWKKVK